MNTFKVHTDVLSYIPNRIQNEMIYELGTFTCSYH